MARVGAHRATNDVDALFNVAEERQIVAVLARGEGVEPLGGSHVEIHGVKVDILAARPLGTVDIRDLPEDLDQRGHVLSHGYAVEQAAELVVAVRASSGGAEESCRLVVALPEALLVTKLHAAISRHHDGELKKRNDLHDVYRLLRRHGPSISRALRVAHPLLREWTEEVTRKLFVTERTQSRRLLGGGAGISEDDLAAAAGFVLAETP